MLEFPVSSEALLTLFGGVIVAAICGLWLKHYLADWRYTPLFVLLCTELMLLLVLFASSAWRPSAERIISVAVIALVAATLESWGYEALINIIGKMGFGPRSDAAQVARARETVLQADLKNARRDWFN